VDGQSQRPAQKGRPGSEGMATSCHAGPTPEPFEGCKGGPRMGARVARTACCGTDARVVRVTDHQIASLVVPVGVLNQSCLYADGALPVSAWPLVQWTAASGRRSGLLCPVAALRKSCGGVYRSGCSGGLPDTGGGYRALDYWHQRWRRPPDPPNPNGPDEQP
jgi:hypothetical protein